MKKATMMIAMLIFSVSVYAQHDHSEHHKHKSETTAQETTPDFKDDNVRTAYDRYIDLKDALVASDDDRASRMAEQLAAALSRIEGGAKAKASADEVAEAKTLAARRTAFSALSDQMVSLVKSADLTSGQIYVAYCPMAESNDGAQWLANEKTINNPYFGDRMLRCGKVNETIK